MCVFVYTQCVFLVSLCLVGGRCWREGRVWSSAWECWGLHIPHISPSSPCSPLTTWHSGRRKPAEYNRKVAWRAYSVQFEMLAAPQGCSEVEKALHLATMLQGVMAEVLGLPPSQCILHESVVEALQRCFRHHYQAEVYRARLKKWTQEQVETLFQVAQNMEVLGSHRSVE